MEEQSGNPGGPTFCDEEVPAPSHGLNHRHHGSSSPFMASSYYFGHCRHPSTSTTSMSAALSMRVPLASSNRRWSRIAGCFGSCPKMGPSWALIAAVVLMGLMAVEGKSVAGDGVDKDEPLVLPVVAAPYHDTGKSSALFGSRAGPSTGPSAFSSKAKILAQVATDVVLPCRLRDSGLAGEGAVSWMKRGQYDLLTVGNKTYTDDPRFKPVFIPEQREWGLRIFPVEINDTGTYQCQVPTLPPTVSYVELKVIRAISEIPGREIHVNSGSVLNLRCIVRNLIRKPSFIFWYHTAKDPAGSQPQLMNYESRVKMSIVDGEEDPMNQSSPNNNNNNHHQQQPGRLDFRQARPTAMTMAVTTEEDGVGFVVTGLLTIERITGADSGNFTCSPQHAASSVISVHVLSDGEHQAAIQQGSAATLALPTLPFLTATLALLASSTGAAILDLPLSIISRLFCNQVHRVQR